MFLYAIKPNILIQYLLLTIVMYIKPKYHIKQENYKNNMTKAIGLEMYASACQVNQYQYIQMQTG